MVWKLVGNTAGDSTHVGGTDWNKISNYFSGVSNVDNADINSSTTYRSGKLKIRNPANTFSYTVNAEAITSNRTATLPLLTANDEFLFRDSTQEITNKTISAAKNNLTGFLQAPEAKKYGFIQCGPAVTRAEGLLDGFVNTVTPVFNKDVNGTKWEYNTGTTANTNAGIRFGTTFSRTQYNPRLKCRFAIDSTTDSRFFFGLNSDITLESNDTPVESTENGFMVGWRTTDSTFKIFTNDLAGSTSVIDAGITKNINVNTIEIIFSGGGIKADVIINDTTTVSVITNLPTTTDAMALHCVTSNSTTTAKEMDLRYIQIIQDI